GLASCLKSGGAGKGFFVAVVPRTNFWLRSRRQDDKRQKTAGRHTMPMRKRVKKDEAVFPSVAMRSEKHRTVASESRKAYRNACSAFHNKAN
ncbi:hypothetical protein, partial [uncultured Desulfovibrio sp.]|uniref:hypothetical protein n=1 Tax=uncultured Desulfovibrio sp. TaxID=167968 RepID=UPI00272A4553